jgi:hypothetical protein
MEKVTVQPGQSLFDIALQTLGDVEEGLEKLALHNGKEYADSLTAGEELEYDPAWISNLGVVNHYKRIGSIPATGGTVLESDVTLSGVGYDVIEDTLIVYE